MRTLAVTALVTHRASEAFVCEYYGSIQLSPETATHLYDKLLEVVESRTTGAEKRMRQQRKRILALEDKRRRLLQMHLSGDVELDLFSEEQDRITKQLADAGAALAN